MRTASRVLAPAIVAALALGGAVPASSADARPTLEITPMLPEPGGHVVLAVDGGCSSPEITATSPGLSGPVPLGNEGADHYVGSGRVASYAEIGMTYEVTTHCPAGGPSVLGRFTVGRGGARGPLADESRTGDAGPNTVGFLAGGVLLALAAGGSVVAIRRRGRGGA